MTIKPHPEAIFDLKNCPFCGSDEPYFEEFEDGHIDDGEKGDWRVYCGRCGSAVPYAKTAKEAAEMWNGRAGVKGEATSTAAELVAMKTVHDTLLPLPHMGRVRVLKAVKILLDIAQ